MKFNKDIYDETYVMHCTTKEESIIFTRQMKITDRYNRLKQDTCYRFMAGDSYANIHYYRDKGYTILEFCDFEWDGYEDNTLVESPELDCYIRSFCQEN